jgi:hypothetical protein
VTAPWEPSAIDDVPALVRSGQIVPLHSAESPVYRRSQSGEMPPPAGLPRLTQAELDILALWIDTPSFWPEPAAPAACETPPALADFDLVFQSVANDLATLPSVDQPFYRYLSLTNRSNAACDEAELASDRHALFKGLNMLSLNPSVHAPVAIDAAQRIYRIDLRDFDWTRAIELGGQSFPDVWEAIAAASPYSIEFSGSAAALAKQATATAFPVLFANHLLDQALAGDLYYAILGLPRSDLRAFLYDAWGLDAAQDLEDGLERRAGTWKSRVTQADRLVQRDQLGSRGVLWQAFEIDDRKDASMFEEPLQDWGVRRQIMFTLPNGLFGFISTDPNDRPLTDTQLLLDTLDDPLPARGVVSCSACHASGLIPVVDEVKNVSTANAKDIGLNAEQVALLDQVYPDSSAFGELVASDSAPYGQALARLQLASSGSDPVATAALRFDAPLTLRDAAGELGVRPDVLAGGLARTPWLAPLGSGTLGRDAFAAVYVASLCVLDEALENRPDRARCERELAALRGQSSAGPSSSN